jgi:type IV secretory pathway TraG/TraD family ATPase VirD4
MSIKEAIVILQINSFDEDIFDEEYKFSTKKKKKKHKKDNVIPYNAGMVIADAHQLMRNTAFLRGNVIPDWMHLDLRQDGGFHFGLELSADSSYIGKPQDKDGHILVIGGPGSGKTHSIVIPTLYTWQGHTVIFDIKTRGNLLENCRKASRYTDKKLIIFSPAQKNGLHYDPFAFLDSDDPNNLPRNAKDLALALLPLSKSARDIVWTKAAQNLLTAAIIHFHGLGATFSETMTAVQYYSAKQLIDEINSGTNMAAKLFIGKLKDLKKSTLANIDMDLTDLAILAADSAFCGARDTDILDWSILNISEKPVMIVLSLPEENLDVWEPMVKLMFNQMTRTLQRRADKYSAMGEDLLPVLVMCEEFAALGELPLIHRGLSTLRDRGVTFCLVVQSFAQLDLIYDAATRRAIVDSCAFKAILHASDPECQRYLSDMIGTWLAPRRSFNMGYNPAAAEITNYNLQFSESQAPILYPHWLNNLGDDMVLITPNGFCMVKKNLHFSRRINLFLTPRLGCNY